MHPDGGFLTRFAPKRWTTALLWTLLWVVLNVAPFGFMDGLAEDLWFWQTDENAGLLDLSGLYSLLPFALVCELYGIATIFGLAKGRLLFGTGSPWLAASAAAAAVSAVAFFALCVLLSWSLHGRAGSFLGLESVRLFAFALDPSNLVSITSAADGLQWIGASLAALGASLTLFVLSPPLPDWRRAVLPAAVALWMFGMLYYLFDELRDRTPAGSLNRLQVSAHHAISPRMSLLWGPLFLGGSEEFEVVELSHLEPYRGLDAYAEGIETAAKPRKNVLVIVVEALRADTLANQGGDPRILPNVNRLAAQGHAFQNARAQSSETDASWVAILTGLYPLRFPYRDLRRDTDYPYSRIYDVLSAAGYRTALVTHEWDITRRVTRSPDLDLHFDPLTETPQRLVEQFPQISEGRELTLSDIHALDRINVAQLQRWLRADSSTPFFAALYLESTHFPYPQERLTQQPFSPHDLASAPSFLDYPEALAPVMRNRYWNTLRSADAMIARLVEDLDAQGRLDDTLILVTGDHGQMFHEHGAVTHGRYLYEEAIRVPLVIWGAGGRQPRDVSRPVAHIDIPPTILDLLGLPPRGSFQGESLFGAQAPITGCRPVFSSVQLITFEDAVVCWPFKYVRNYWGRGERLFDLLNDPGEGSNLAERDLEKRDQMRALLTDFRNRQLSYYRLSNRQRHEAFPPRYERLIAR